MRERGDKSTSKEQNKITKESQKDEVGKEKKSLEVIFVAEGGQ